MSDRSYQRRMVDIMLIGAAIYPFTVFAKFDKRNGFWTGSLTTFEGRDMVLVSHNDYDRALDGFETAVMVLAGKLNIAKPNPPASWYRRWWGRWCTFWGTFSQKN